MSFRLINSHQRDKYKDSTNPEVSKSEGKIKKSFFGKKVDKISRFIREVYNAPADLRHQYSGGSAQKRYEVPDSYSYNTGAKNDSEVASKIARGNLRQGAVPQQTNSLGALDKVKVINVRSAPSDATMDDLGDSGDSKNDFCDKITKAGSFS